MLHLVDKSKVGRNLKDDSGEQIDWRNLFKSSEDSFTSSIFSLLSYLPASEFWFIIKDAMLKVIDDQFEIPTRLNSIRFWPRWNDNVGGYCEPDVFIEFDTFNLIIEAKRWDYHQQNLKQWQTEIQNYFIEFENKGKKLVLLAVGGNADNMHSEIIIQNGISVPILKLKWRKLLNVINERKKYLNEEHSNLLHIYNDLILSFRIHGFQTGLLFDSMPLYFEIDYSKMRVIEKNSLYFFKCQNLPNVVIENYLELIKIL